MLRIDASSRHGGAEAFAFSASREVQLAIEPYPGLRVTLTPLKQWARVAVVNEVIVTLAADDAVFVHAHALLVDDYSTDELTRDGWLLQH